MTSPARLLAPLLPADWWSRRYTNPEVNQILAGNKLMFADLGETELRGFEDPVRLYELRWRQAG